MNNIQVGQKNRFQNVENQNISTANDTNNGKFDYICPLSPLNRLVKLINAFVITLFTGFLALAFKDVRNLWAEGFTGKEIVAISLNNSQNEGKNFMSQIKNLSEKNQVLENQIRFLNESLQGNRILGSQENPYQQQQIHQLKKELGKKNLELTNLKSQISQLSKQNSHEIINKLNQANREKQILEEVILNLRKQVEEIKQKQNKDIRSNQQLFEDLYREKEDIKTQFSQAINKLTSNISDRDIEIQKLEKKLKENNKIEEVNKKFRVKEKEADKAQIEQLKLETNQLRNLLNAAKKELDELDQVKNANQHLQDIIHQLQNKLNPLEKAYEQLKAESKETESQELTKLAGLNKKLEDELSKEIKRNKTLIINQLGAKLTDQSKENVSDYSKQQTDLKVSYEQEISKLQGRISELENEMKLQISENAKLVELGKLPKEINLREPQEPTKDHQKYLETIHQLEDKIKIESEKVSKLQKEKLDIENRDERFEQDQLLQISELQKEVRQLNNSKAELTVKLNTQVFSQSTELQKKYESEIESLKEVIATHKATIAKLEEEMLESEKINVEYQNTKQKELDQQSEEIVQKDTKITDLNCSLNEVKENYRAEKILSTQLDNDLKELQKENKQMSERNTLLNNNVNELYNEIEALKLHINTLVKSKN